MRSRREISVQLEHVRSGACTGDAATNAGWIAALQWVLGDARHQAAFAEYVASIRALAPEGEPSSVAFHDTVAALVGGETVAIRMDRIRQTSERLALNLALALIE